MSEHFYDGRQVVDWYHAKTHLAHAANDLHGEGTAAAQHWLHRRETTLFQGHVDQIVNHLPRPLLTDLAHSAFLIRLRSALKYGVLIGPNYL